MRTLAFMFALGMIGCAGGPAPGAPVAPNCLWTINGASGEGGCIVDELTLSPVAGVHVFVPFGDRSLEVNAFDHTVLVDGIAPTCPDGLGIFAPSVAKGWGVTLDNNDCSPALSASIVSVAPEAAP